MATNRNRTLSRKALKGKVANETEIIRPFEQSLPMLLMRARDSVMSHFRPHLRRHQITEQQWRILRVLAEEKDADMLSLSVRCCIQPPSLSRTIPLLIERGLVRRCNHGNDQRRIMVNLTPQGRSLFRVMSTESARIYQEIQQLIKVAALPDLYEVLNSLITVLGQERIDPIGEKSSAHFDEGDLA